MITLTLPWAAMMHDNHRLIPAGKGRKGLIASPEYRSRKATARMLIMGQCRDLLPPGDMVLRAVLYFPDRRKRDAGNYRKLITDALTDLVYADDSQLVSETWERGGIDRKNPRAEIAITSTSNADSIPESDECGCDNCRRVT